MPRSSNQKLKILVLADIFQKESSEEHPLTMPEIIEKMRKRGIEAERKSLYDDFDVLTNYGMEIIKVGASRNTAYYMVGSSFEAHELKLLADAVACSKFITEKKSRELIAKLGELANKYDSGELKRNVIVFDRIKNVNEQIYNNVDKIQSAISSKRKIRFLYYHYDRKKQKCYHNDGAYSEVSPYALCWRDDNYYLVGYYGKYDSVTNFRVDKMERTEVITDEKRIEPPKNFNLGEYTTNRFGMFSGEATRITLKVHNSLSSVIFDRFGKNILISNYDDEHFSVNQPVVISNVFFGWVCQFGEKIEIISPENVRNDFKDYIKNISDLYK